MNTTYEPVDRDFLFSLALAKAKGRTWQQISEKAKMSVIDLEIIPWREPKEWAKACKYAEKLVHHESLSEMLATLRSQMNDPVNNGRLKTQIANSIVRTIQLQQALRTPKKPKKPTLHPSKEPTPTPTLPPTVNEPAVPPSPPATPPKPAMSSTPLGTIAAVVLFVLGLLASCCTTIHAASIHDSDHSPVMTITHDESIPIAVLTIDDPTLEEELCDIHTTTLPHHGSSPRFKNAAFCNVSKPRSDGHRYSDTG